MASSAKDNLKNVDSESDGDLKSVKSKDNLKYNDLQSKDSSLKDCLENVNPKTMDEMYKLSKDNFATNMWTEFSEMMQNEVVSDLQIEVEKKVFNVHRFMLIAASRYFKNLFRSNKKKVKQKCIEIEGVKADGIKYCIQFIYTRDIDLSKSPIESILCASHRLEINALTNLCFGYLRLNISNDNCISTLKLSKLYQNKFVKNTVDQYIINNWKNFVTTENLLSLDLKDLIRYLENTRKDYASSWKAVVCWLDKYKESTEQVLLQLIKTMKIENFPFEFLLNTVLAGPLVQCHQKACDEVMNNLCSNPDQLKQNLSLETIFPLRKIVKKDEPNAKESLKYIREFIENNFASLSQKEEIRDLDEKEIVQLFQSQNSYIAEETKFFAAVNWAETDEIRKKKQFPKLFELIELKRLSPDFIEQKVRSESLVKGSPECLNHMLDHSTLDRTPDPHIACLYQETDEIKIFNPSKLNWLHLAKVPEASTRNIIGVGKMLYLLADKDLLVLQKGGTWLKKTSMPRRPLRVVSFQDRIYGVDNDTMSCYDPMQDTWNTNLPGCGLSQEFLVASSAEFIYAMGGAGTDNKARKFDPNTQTWSNITSMNFGRFGASAAVLNGKVFVMGGYNDRPLHDVECFDPTQQRWNNVAGLCHPRAHLSSCVVNNKLYAIGGACDAEGTLFDPDSIEVFTYESEKFEFVSEMQKSGFKISSCVFDPV